MLKHLSAVVALGLLSLPTQAKENPPKPGAYFLLTRVVKGQEIKVAENEVFAKGTLLRFHAEAQGQPCTIVAPAFQLGKARETGSLTPLLFCLKTDEQGVKDFEIKESLKASQFFVIVTPQSSSNSQTLTQLASDWQARPAQSQGARTALHDKLSVWIAKQDKSLTYSGPPVKETGGVRSTSAESVNPNSSIGKIASMAEQDVRSEKLKGQPAPSVQLYNWRNEAKWLPCSAAQPGVFVYHLGK